MGQILHAGIYRQKGPQGGDLAPVGNTGWLAEKTESGKTRQLTLWKPGKRDDFKTWTRAGAEGVLWKESVHLVAEFTQEGVQRTARFGGPEEGRMALRTLADWVIRPRLLKEQGVAEVIILGGDRKQYQVLIDTDRDGATSARFKVESIPTIVLLDAAGTELARGAPLTAGSMLSFLGDRR